MPVRARLSPDQVQEALRLQSQFWTQDRIATHLGVHRNTVRRHLARVNSRAFERLEKRAAATKARQVAQLETVASEAFDAWLRSKEEKVTNRDTESTGGENGPSSSSLRETSTHHCDSSLLNQARGALADVRKILGLEDVADVAVGKVQVQIEFVDGDTDHPEDQTPQAPPSTNAGGSGDGPV